MAPKVAAAAIGTKASNSLVVHQDYTSILEEPNEEETVTQDLLLSPSVLAEDSVDDLTAEASTPLSIAITTQEHLGDRSESLGAVGGRRERAGRMRATSPSPMYSVID